MRMAICPRTSTLVEKSPGRAFDVAEKMGILSAMRMELMLCLGLLAPVQFTQANGVAKEQSKKS